MKVFRFAALVGVAVLGLASCASIADDIARAAIRGSINSSSGSSGSSDSARAAPVAVIDFQSGEILASTDNGKMEDAAYYVSKVLQAPSAATNNQAQVIFIEDGKKYWVNFLVESRKAVKDDLKVGTTVLYLPGWQRHDEISAESYRKENWKLGNITSVNNLFKNYVEIDGDDFNITYIRIPTSPIK